MATHHIGTSGWSYPHWQDAFYPQGLPPGQRLAHYAAHLGSAEINNSFYSLPSVKTLKHWRDSVPATFIFAAKASRYITHMKKLKDPVDPVTRFVERMDVLGDQLGPILFQLPPRWRCNHRRLATFLDALDDCHRWAFELRDHRWIGEETLSLLRRHNAAFCIYELDGYQSPQAVTADFVYLRLHGPAGPYQGDYDAAALDHWAGAVSDWLAEGLDVYCYFDNDEKGYAAHNARALAERLTQRLVGTG
jgi:uncharacterized protein YecE (DUF72 family)